MLSPRPTATPASWRTAVEFIWVLLLDLALAGLLVLVCMSVLHLRQWEPSWWLKITSDTAPSSTSPCQGDVQTLGPGAGAPSAWRS